MSAPIRSLNKVRVLELYDHCRVRICMTYSATYEILKASENAYLNSPGLVDKLFPENVPRPIRFVLGVVNHYFVYPFAMVAKGHVLSLFNFFRMSLWLVSFYLLLLKYAEIAGGHPLSMKGPASDLLFYVAFTMALVVTILVPPSLFFREVVPEEPYLRLKQVIARLPLQSVAEVDAIRSNLSVVEERVKARLVKLQAVITLGWGVIVFIANKMFDFLLKNDMAKVSGGVEPFAFLTLLLFFVFVVVDGYSKSRFVVFKLAEFALNDIRVSLQSEQASERKFIWHKRRP